MNIELKEIRDFLAKTTPFDNLPIEKVEELTHASAIRYIRRGSPMPPTDVSQSLLYVIRKGSITLQNKQGELHGKLSDGNICTFFCSGGENIEDIIEVVEDTLIYSIPCQELYEIIKDHPSVVAFIHNNSSQRLSDAVGIMADEVLTISPLMRLSTAEVMHATPISTPADSSIYQSAKMMADNGISSLLITEDAKPVGIITDRDITKRCVAVQLSVESSVSKIMTTKMQSVTSDSSAYDALMIMTRKHIHHLPVIDGEELVGIMTITDLIRHEGKNSAYLTSAIRKAKTIEELQLHSQTIPNLQVQLVRMGANAEHVGKGVTSITTAITLRLIEMAEEKLGPAPVPYAWVAAGSQARREQTSHTDQDNGLIISDDMTEADKPWFEALAKFVCDGLDACGYIYCPGNVMAMNPEWRQTASVWAGYFDKWIHQPEPKALMYCSIFFDLRTIHGDKKLLKNIRKKNLKETQKSTLFLALLTRNALKLKPPLGFFRDFVLIHDGEHNATLDLKHNGIAPIVDLARIYALSEGISEVNTVERIKKAAGTKSLSAEGAANLLAALTFIGSLRIKHQSNQIRNGEIADNYMPPKAISKLEREHMKDAFKVIQTMQSSLEKNN